MFRLARSSRLVLIALLLALLAPALPASAAAMGTFYTITELPTLGGEFTYATDVNDAGQVVGMSQLPSGVYHAFRYDDGAMTDLGTLGGWASHARKINNAGDIIGDADRQSGTSAFLYRNGAMIDLGAMAPLSEQAGPVPTALNDAGLVIGTYGVSGYAGFYVFRSWLYDQGRFTIIPIGPTGGDNTSCGGFRAIAINGVGQVVGNLASECSRVPSPAKAYLYDYAPGAVTDLDALGIHGVMAINDQGQMVGFDAASKGQLFSYHPPGNVTATPLGTLPGFETMTPYDLNNAGEVVGTAAADTAAPDDRHAFLYRDGAMHDLNELLLPNSGWVVREGWALNNRGQIVGLAWRDGRERPVLLTPGFRDVPDNAPYRDAILSLASRGVIRGYEDGRFGPADHALRAQSAAFIARAIGWDGEDWADVNFPDQGYIDDALWRNVRTLAHYQVALGYEDGTYNPTGEVLYQQVVLFIARAMIARGSWVEQADMSPYPNLPNTTDREKADRRAVATYVYYAGAVPDRPVGQAWADWDEPATRGWFAHVLWQALQTLPGVGQVRPILRQT